MQLTGSVGRRDAVDSQPTAVDIGHSQSAECAESLSSILHTMSYDPAMAQRLLLLKELCLKIWLTHRSHIEKTMLVELQLNV